MTSLLRLRFYFLPNMSSCRVSAEWATRRPCSSSTGGRWFRRRSWRAGPCVAWWTTSPSKPSATPCGPWSYPPPGPPRAIFKPPPCSPSEWRARPKKPSRTAPSWKPRATAARGTEETARRRRRRRRRGIRSLSGLSVESFPCLALRVSLSVRRSVLLFVHTGICRALLEKKSKKRRLSSFFTVDPPWCPKMIRPRRHRISETYGSTTDGDTCPVIRDVTLMIEPPVYFHICLS